MLLLVGAGFGLAQVDSGVVRTRAVVDGVPMDLVRPAALTGTAPAVVVAHGHAASRRLMADWGTTLARSGFVVALPDFAGHGANRTPLPDGPAREPRLAADLDAAVGLLRRTPQVDPDRIGLVGHSMGAGAVYRFAAAHPEIAATAAISLPDGAVPEPAAARHLLLLVGRHEFPSFHRAAEQASRAGAPGDHRPVEVLPRAEHLSILFAPRAHADTARWLQNSLGVDAPLGNAAGERIRPAVLLWAAFAVGFVPFARRIVRPAVPADQESPAAPPAIAGAVAAGLAVGWAGSAAAPAGWSPLAVGGELGLFLVLFGLGFAAVPQLRHQIRCGRSGSAWRSVAVACYAALAVLLPIGIGAAEPVPHGARWWWTPLLVASGGIACAAAELAARGRRGVRRDGVRVAVLGSAALGIAVAVGAGLLPGFVVLIAPLLAMLLLWHLAWAAVLARAGAPWWLPAVVGGVLLGWPLAAVSPLG
ncbi:alpha/beta fold hydrolase [Saccharopolyspora sp. NPDC047091]|uniref:alpha/beta fold hydrolase n=1 Tax=Saccharopolyspora sp. NPDC047091 TaxID=3155924 RepID=UPI003410D499